MSWWTDWQGQYSSACIPPPSGTSYRTLRSDLSLLFKDRKDDYFPLPKTLIPQAVCGEWKQDEVSLVHPVLGIFSPASLSRVDVKNHHEKCLMLPGSSKVQHLCSGACYRIRSPEFLKILGFKLVTVKSWELIHQLSDSGSAICHLNCYLPW